MTNKDERITLDISEWADEHVHCELERFQQSDFEARLRQRLSRESLNTVLGAKRRLWLPVGVACAMLVAVIGAVVYFRQPSFRPASGKESIRTFFADYSTLGRLQTASYEQSRPARAIHIPEMGEERLSRQEISKLFRAIIPWRDLSAGQLEEPRASHDAPRELKQTIDRFFSITLKSLKEKT
jgi:hypothetical protein